MRRDLRTTTDSDPTSFSWASLSAFICGGCEVTGEAADTETFFDLYEAYIVFCRCHGLMPIGLFFFQRRMMNCSETPWEAPDGRIVSFERASRSGRRIFCGIRVLKAFRPFSPALDD